VAICDMDMVGLLCSGIPENTMTRDMVIDAMVDATAIHPCAVARRRAGQGAGEAGGWRRRRVRLDRVAW
jgi:hypothetical protein